MRKTVKVNRDEPMSDLVEKDYRVLTLMGRLGMELGFGDKTVAEVCLDSGVDIDTFSVVVEMALGEEPPSPDEISKVSLSTLLDGLVCAHGYYVGHFLPSIRQKLIEAWGESNRDLLKAIVGYYDEFLDNLRRHVELEEQTVFPCFRALEAGGYEKCGQQSQSHLDEHEPIVDRLGEMTRLLIKYCPGTDTNRMNEVVFDLVACEGALQLHRKMEEVLIPAKVASLEKVPGRPAARG